MRMEATSISRLGQGTISFEFPTEVLYQISLVTLPLYFGYIRKYIQIPLWVAGEGGWGRASNCSGNAELG